MTEVNGAIGTQIGNLVEGLRQKKMEQAEAQKARRAAQAADKAARQNKAGGNTIFNSKTGKYESVQITPEQIAAKRAKRAAEQAAKENKFGGKTVFDASTGKHVSLPATTVKEQALSKIDNIPHAEIIEETSKKGGTGFMSKLGKFAKKAGKWGLIAGAVAGLAYLGKKVYDHFAGNKAEESPVDNKKAEPPKTTKPVDKTPANPENPDDKKPDDKAPVATPIPENPDKTDKTNPEDKADKTDKTDKTDKSDKASTATGNVYVVKKGDNVWNIAKKHLQDMNPDPNYQPTNAEILKYTNELIKINGLHYEDDNYRVIIKPNDELKLTA